MKKFGKFGLILSALIFSAVSLTAGVHVTYGDKNDKSGKRLRGNGVIITKTISAPEFTAVEAHRDAEVRLVASTDQQITVRADENVMPYAVITCEKGVLVITIDPAVKNLQDITYEVSVPINDQIRSLKSTSSGEINLAAPLHVSHTVKVSGSSTGEIEGSIVAPALSLDLSSAASAELSIQVEELNVDLSSASEAELKGRATQMDVNISTASELDAEELECQNCDIDAASASSASLLCQGKLKASASSASRIEYRGNCTVEKRTSSAGTVRFDKD